MLLEFGAFGVGDGPVFLDGAHRASAGEVGLVVADDVFFEHRDVAAGHFEVEMAQ